MIQFVIRQNTGININNIPGDIFAIINAISVDDEGQVIINCEQEMKLEINGILQRLYRNLCPNETLFFVEHDGMIMVQKTQPQLIDGILLPCAINTTTVGGMQMEVQHIQVPVTPNENQERDQDLNPDDTFDPDDEIDGELTDSEYIASNKSENGKEKMLLAKAMRNSLSSSSTLLFDKVSEFNKLMAKSIILKNEIELLSKPIDDNPKINLIVNQIKNINDNLTEESLIKSVYINDGGNISVLTKRLSTEILADNTIRDVGEMEIIILSTIILSENLQNTSISNPVIIKNLTHVLEANDRTWACGHAPSNQICFGHIYEQIHKALLDKNIDMIIQLVIRFIRNPDINDAWGKFILGFPEVERNNQ